MRGPKEKEESYLRRRGDEEKDADGCSAICLVTAECCAYGGYDPDPDYFGI